MQDKRILLGTNVEIKVITKDKRKAQEKIDLAFREMRRLERIFSAYDPKSELSWVNKNAFIRPVRVSKELFYVLKEVIRFAEISGGAFDPTINSEDRGVSYRDIVLDEKKRTVFFTKPGLRVDLGGCAKGYIVDCTAERLRDLGLRCFLINAGGDIKAEGKNWRVGIEDPLSRGRVLKVLKLKDKAIASSGNYLRPHILDPQTKKPVENDLLESSVISETCLKSDILATAVFVSGKGESLEWIKRIKGVRLIMVLREGEGERIVEWSEGNPVSFN